ncbi:uncharacterized protein LOC127858290 [Dreissena polymorpha]|uniref:Uncharacterized protein n=1 Tax=Dreissena polymorpha TaxID=45954 RepID=A0A9D4BSF5_DREPO|nr:uncharacterized protein LOC127858290 [Dreissena polymorpha]KAH3706534.1 hypothetical protein DPMN_065921 [Dreissena polymorpha]
MSSLRPKEQQDNHSSKKGRLSSLLSPSPRFLSPVSRLLPVSNTYEKAVYGPIQFGTTKLHEECMKALVAKSLFHQPEQVSNDTNNCASFVNASPVAPATTDNESGLIQDNTTDSFPYMACSKQIETPQNVARNNLGEKNENEDKTPVDEILFDQQSCSVLKFERTQDEPCLLPNMEMAWLERDSRQQAHSKIVQPGTNQDQSDSTGDCRTRSRHTSSFNSACSTEDSALPMSQCSTCGVCNSAGVLRNLANNQLYFEEDFDHVNAGSEVEKLGPDDSYLDSYEEIFLRHVKSLAHTDRAVNSKPESQHSGEHVIFTLIQILLIRYRHLVEASHTSAKVSASHRQTTVYITQAIMVLVRRAGKSEARARSLQKTLMSVQKEQSAIRSSVRRVYTVVGVLVALNLLHLPAVRHRLLYILNLFGFIDTAKKVNRLRQTIALNWRSIPTRLIEFWRLFIFRSLLKNKVT